MKELLVALLLLSSSIGRAQINSESIPIRTFCWLYHDHTIWQLTNAGIYIRDENTLKVINRFYIIDDQELYTDIKEDLFNNIWIAMDENGIAKFDGTNWTIWDFHNTPVIISKSPIRPLNTLFQSVPSKFQITKIEGVIL
jgi:hypothetical protein